MGRSAAGVFGEPERPAWSRMILALATNLRCTVTIDSLVGRKFERANDRNCPPCSDSIKHIRGRSLRPQNRRSPTAANRRCNVALGVVVFEWHLLQQQPRTHIRETCSPLRRLKSDRSIDV